jgi:hypothetical protein
VPFLIKEPPALFQSKLVEDGTAMDAVRLACERLGIEPDAKQIEMLASNAPRGIVNCTRQWGKSTMAAVKAVHRVYTRPGSLVLVASPGERQSAMLIRTAAEMLGRLGIARQGDGDNDLSLLLPNGSRIVGLPGTEATVRGFASVSLLLIDEAARMSDELYRALRPMLAVSNGDVWMMSTPWGRQGFFYETWANGGERWTRVRVPATECRRISAEYLEEERSEMGGWFEQEFLCEFVDNGSRAFERELVESAVDTSVDAFDFGRKPGQAQRK